MYAINAINKLLPLHKPYKNIAHLANIDSVRFVGSKVKRIVTVFARDVEILIYLITSAMKCVIIVREVN